MTPAARWIFSLLLPFLLSACATGGGSTADLTPGLSGTSTSIQLDKTVYFTAPGGAPVLATQDEYLVEQTEDAQIRLVPDKGGLPLLLAADIGTHDLEVSEPFPLILALNDDARDVVLLMPDGTALDARGSLSGLRTRDIVRARRHYQLAYQLNQTTGQVQFGDGAPGQRLPANQSRVASNYRLGTGSIGNIATTKTAELDMVDLQSIVSQRQLAISLAQNIAAAQNEPFHLEYNMNRPGNDHGQRTTVSPEACRAICSADGVCQAFTYVKPPAGTSAGQCYLKRAVPAQTANPCCVSAKRKSAQQELIGNIGR